MMNSDAFKARFRDFLADQIEQGATLETLPIWFVEGLIMDAYHAGVDDGIKRFKVALAEVRREDFERQEGLRRARV